MTTPDAVTTASPARQVPADIAALKGEPSVLAALAAGATVEAAATAGDVTERTVYRRLADDAYRDEVERHREEAIAQALGRLTAASASAVDHLVELAEHAESETVRLKAADRIVVHALAMHDHVSVLSRLAEVEAALETLTGERDRKPKPPAKLWEVHTR